jgi:signal peptidase I
MDLLIFAAFLLADSEASMLFVLGDNRDHSYDSRHYGFVPTTNVLGRPRLVYWSVEAPMALGHIRWSRIGQALN